MSETPDTYLVEKLREILLRIYKKHSTSLTPLSTPSPVPRINPGLKSDTLIENYSVRFLNDQKWYFENKSLLGVDGENSTRALLSLSPNSESDEEIQTDRVLKKNLNEFIQVLKMSLISSTSSNSPVAGVGTMTTNHGTIIPAVTVSNTEIGLDFNLTLDDISDLNNLMDGSSSMSLKHIVLIFSYFIIAFIAIVGNLLVVQLVIRSRRLHTLTHALLANLAVADLLMATINIPFSAARVIMTEWPFGPFLCITVPFVQVTSVYVTSITMAVIAIDRYQVIMKPLGHRLKGSEGIILVFAIWTLSCLFSLPFALHHKVVTMLTVRVVKRCQAEFNSAKSRQWLTVITFLAQYLVPLILTTASYLSIMYRLGHRSSGLGSTTPRQVEVQSRAKQKTIKMLVLTVIFFAICWAPINIYHLLTHFNFVRHDSTAILLCHLIAMSSSCYNPFIYCWLNEHFRREALKWFRCFRTRRSPLVHPGTEINGMITRADLVCLRNQSTTVQTMSFRSHLLANQHFGEHSRNPSVMNSGQGYRPESLFLAMQQNTNNGAFDTIIRPTIDNENGEELSTRLNNLNSVSAVEANQLEIIANNGRENIMYVVRSKGQQHGGSNLSLHSNCSSRVDKSDAHNSDTNV